MVACKHCGVDAKIKFLFCPGCGIRDAFNYQPEERWSEKLRKRLFKSTIEKTIDKFFQDMTPFGNPHGERELERLLARRLSSMEKEKLGASLALGYGIRAQFTERETGDPREAIAIYGDATRVAPKEARWREAKAKSTYRLAKALDVYQKYHITSFMGPDIIKLEEMTDAKESPCDLYERALEAYSDTVQCDPYYVPALIGRARTFVDLGKEAESSKDYQEAVKVLTRALMIDPNDLTSRRERAEAFEALDQIEKAVEDLKHSVAIEKDEWLERRIRELEERLG